MWVYASSILNCKSCTAIVLLSRMSEYRESFSCHIYYFVIINCIYFQIKTFSLFFHLFLYLSFSYLSCTRGSLAKDARLFVLALNTWLKIRRQFVSRKMHAPTSIAFAETSHTHIIIIITTTTIIISQQLRQNELDADKNKGVHRI